LITARCLFTKQYTLIYRHSIIKPRLEKAKDNGTISSFFGHVKIQKSTYRE